MPRRARPADRLKVEELLSDTLRGALVELCASVGIPAEAWQTNPAMQQLFEQHAAMELTARIMVDEGGTYEAAVLTAAARLGMEPATIMSRRRRSRRRSSPAAP